ncbi:GNAT family N-acetyltransferase [Prodigiosinella aquatilis]|nr:GNAT family N-acetyltransferase [Prodigiosinella sp. LS101]WJV54900.1 GNAT family N-acetyltransferase [Prodigiosinella sp. LS101]WJV59263.1 GNAT family N-acetyltransferase [Pectobacteriaceae bacterium C111]
MKEFMIRRIIESDLSNFRRVRLEALRLHPDAFGASYEDWSQKPDHFFADRLRTNHVFGGFDTDNLLQGMIGVSSTSSAKLSHVATIWGMYVREEARGLRLSSGLMAAALEAAGSVKTIKLSVVTTNKVALSLYRSYGFVEWAIDKEALCVDGVFHDEFLMRREVDSGL